MKASLIVASHEYMTLIRNRVVMALAVLAPAFIVLAFLIPNLIQGGGGNQRSIAVWDETGRYGARLIAAAEEQDIRETIADFGRYARNNVQAGFRRDGRADLTRLPPILRLEEQHITDQDVADYRKFGGLQWLSQQAFAFLKEDASPFLPGPNLTRYYLVSNPGGMAGDAIIGVLRTSLENETPLPGAEENDAPAAVLYIPGDITTVPQGSEAHLKLGDSVTVQAMLFSKDEDILEQAATFENRLYNLWREDEIAANPEIAAWDERVAAQRLPLAAEKIGEGGNGGESSFETLIQNGLPFALAYGLAIILLISSQLLMAGAIEEKANRIYETLLTAVSVRQLMRGKLIGLGAATLTFVLIAAIVISGMLTIFSSDIIDFLLLVLRELLSNPFYLVGLLVYFVLGYGLYATLYLSIGSMFESSKEASAIAAPMQILLFASLFAPVVYFENADSLLAKIIPWIPFSTPFTMIVRMAQNPPWWEIAGTIVLLIVTIALFLRMGEKLYRFGIFHSGAAPNLKTIWRQVTGKAA